jgi:hypothetical protein
MRKWIMMVLAVVFLASFCLVGCAGMKATGEAVSLAKAPERCPPTTIQGCGGRNMTGTPIFRTVGDKLSTWPQQGL